jgi:hypothetical protein
LRAELDACEEGGGRAGGADGLTAQASKTQVLRSTPATQSASLTLDTFICGTSKTTALLSGSKYIASPWINASSPERPAMDQSAVTPNLRDAACAWTAGRVG